jgi:hypothetical protein
MFVTEAEAKTKWCPEVRTGLVHGMAVNHHVDMEPKGTGVHDETRCIASGCMMWRCLTHGPKTDIRMRWAACSKWEKDDEKEQK